MSIKCGNCRGTHETSIDVRGCYGLQPASHDAAAAPSTASEKQVTFIAKLAAERGLSVNTDGLTGGRDGTASAEITRLLALPREAQPDTSSNPIRDRDAVREGRYAVTVGDVLKFYKVDKPTDGRWKGYTFVKVQASDDLWPVRGAAATAVLAIIAKDPQAAMLRYGKEIGRCGHCNRTLTNELSRRLGIGPICRLGMGGWLDIALDDDAEEYDPEHGAEAATEMAYERHLEDSGREEADLDRRMEDARGVVQFEDAMNMADANMWDDDSDLVPESDSPLR